MSRHLIASVSFSRDYPWELLINGESVEVWIDDPDFWEKVNKRVIWFLTFSFLDYEDSHIFDVDSDGVVRPVIKKVNVVWHPVHSWLDRFELDPSRQLT